MNKLAFAFLLTVSSFFTSQAVASFIVDANVDKVFCGEVSPALGELCMLYMTTTQNQKVAVAYDRASYTNYFQDKDLTSLDVRVNMDTYQRPGSENKAAYLKLDPSYYYLEGGSDVESITLL